MFLGGLIKNVGEFLSDYKECHATVIGFAEGFIPWMPNYQISEDLEKQASDEYHYYTSAMVIGHIAYILTIAGVVVWGITKVVSLFI